MKPIVFDLEKYLSTRTKLVGDCIMFTNKPNAQGYGVVAPNSWIKKTFGEKLLHRVVYTYNYDIIPKGMCIMHTCDNRMCINVKHLKLGTWADNNLDRKLNGKVPAKGLSKKFNVNLSTIYYIWSEKRWRHI